MFTGLIAFLTSWFNWGKLFKLDTWEKSIAWVTTVWGVVVLVAGWVWWCWDTLKSGIVLAAGYVDSIVLPELGVVSGSVVQWLSIANTFVPLAELFAFMVAYLALLTALTSLRIVRKAASFIFGV